MAESTQEVAKKVELAAGMIAGSQNTLPIVKAMEFSGFDEGQRRNMRHCTSV